jgi:hypothetical protein
MQVNQAKVVDIPRQTKSEREFNDLSSIQNTFGVDEDVSRLDLTTRRARKIEVNDIDEHIKRLEIEAALELSVKGIPVCTAGSTEASFNNNYKMKLSDIDDQQGATQKRRRSQLQDLDLECSTQLEDAYSLISSPHTVDHRKSRINSVGKCKQSIFVKVSNPKPASERGSLRAESLAIDGHSTVCPVGIYCRISPLEVAVRQLKQETKRTPSKCKPSSVDTTRDLPVTCLYLVTPDAIYMNESLQDSKIFMKKHSITLLRRHINSTPILEPTQKSGLQQIGSLSPTILSTNSRSPNTNVTSPISQTSERQFKRLSMLQEDPLLTEPCESLLRLFREEIDPVSYKLIPPIQGEGMIFELDDSFSNGCPECPGQRSTSKTTPRKANMDSIRDQPPKKQDFMGPIDLSAQKKAIASLIPECIQILVYNTISQIAVVLVFQSEDYEDPDHYSLWRIHIYNKELSMQSSSLRLIQHLEYQMREECLMTLKRFLNQLHPICGESREKPDVLLSPYGIREQDQQSEPTRKRSRFGDIEIEDLKTTPQKEYSLKEDRAEVKPLTNSWQFSL